MAAGAFAMEAATYQTAALIDSGEGDYMIETALLKVFSTEVLWRIINDCIQIFGGKAYFTDEPYERLMRDARINTIGEGANDVLRAFAALVGMRDVGLELQGVLEAAKTPWRNLGRLTSFAGRRIEAMFAAPAISVLHTELDHEARRLGKLVSLLGSQVERLLAHYQESILDRQYQQGRVADAAIEIYTSACVLRRLDQLRSPPIWPRQTGQPRRRPAAIICVSAERRIRRSLGDLWANDDQATTELADLVLERQRGRTGDTEA